MFGYCQLENFGTWVIQAFKFPSENRAAEHHRNNIA